MFNNFPLPYDNTQVTVELRQLVESGVNVWAFDYPSYYKGEDKIRFEKKVLDHFWLRQIGLETPGRWLHYFRSRIREIMPYYIQLYESEALMKGIDDPFGNVDIVETFEEESTSGNNGTSTGQRKFSNTPQGSIENLDHYMTEAETSQATAAGEARGTVKHTMTKKGNQGVNTYAHDMKELRATFLNIDLDIINELNDLFLRVY